MVNFKNVILVVRGCSKPACLLIPILLLAFFGTSVAQQHRLLFHAVGVNEGLSHNSVYSLLQDKSGYVWAGTADGLNRYDGRQVKVYRPADAMQNAEAAYIRNRLVEDKQGNIWYVCYTGIYCLNKKLDRLERKLELKSLTALYFLDRNGVLWLHDLNRGIVSYNIFTGKTVLYPYPFSFEYSRYRNLRVTTDDRQFLWVSLYDNGTYYRFDVNSKKYKELRYKDKITLMACEGSRLWLSDDKAVDVFDAAQMRLFSSVKWKGGSLSKAKLLRDSKGHVFISAHSYGLYCVDDKGNILDSHQRDSYVSNTIPSDNVTDIIEDRSGNLWVSTDAGGIAYADLKTPPFGKFPLDERDHPQLKDFIIWSIYEGRDGKIWFGNIGNGLNIYDAQTGSLQQIPLPDGRKDIHVRTIYESTDNKVWVGYSNGVGYMQGNILKKVEPGWQGEDNIVYELLNKGDDTMLVATALGPKILFRKNGKWEEQKQILQYSLKRKVTDIIPDKNGKYWMVFPAWGLLSVSYDGEHFQEVDSFLGNMALRSVHRDELEPYILWVASGTGLWKFDSRSGKAILFNTKHGLPNANIYGVLEDEAHDIWVSTNGGLSCYKRKQNSFSNYFYNNGLQSNEFNSGAFHKGYSGKLYFGGIKGFNWLTGKSVRFDTAKPQVVITDIIAGDSILIPHSVVGNTVELSYKKNSITINVAVADYTNPDANHVRYKLLDWDKSWNDSKTGEIRYASLLPGDYTLYIHGVSSNQQLSAPYVIKVRVNAPFWQQVWFRWAMALSVMIVIALLTYLWYRRKVNSALEALEREKMLAAERSRISRDLHDDIGGAITKITLLSELIPLQNDGRDKMLEDVKAISSTAREVSQSMSEIVWALHTQHDTLEGLLSYLREQVREFLERINIRYELHFPAEPGMIHLSGEQRRNILLVIKEALNNVVKHSDANLVRLSCTHDASEITFVVTDDGKGFDITKMEEQGNGLRNMRKRMESMGGKMVILQGKGTSVVFSMPL